MLEQRDRHTEMAPPLRTMVALCAPAALVAFVVRPNPGSSIRRAPSSAGSTSAVQQVRPKYGKIR